MQNLMAQIFAPLETGLPSGSGIRHKTAWLRYVADGRLPMPVEALHDSVRRVVHHPENAPHGERILELHVRSRFTLYSDGRVPRPEEALERLVVVSNPLDVYNQVPTRGRKESLDLLRLTSEGCMECIELKAWGSDDTPFYALVELLKNLEIIRLLAKEGRGPHHVQDSGTLAVRQTGLTLLAPLDYYRAYGLLDPAGRPRPDALHWVEDLLSRLSLAFQVPIAFLALKYSWEEFQGVCQRLVTQRDADGKVDVEQLPPIPALEHGRWMPLAAS